VVVDAFRCNRSPPEFPDNRENNREFFKFGPFSAILAPNRRVNSASYNEIPYATEQGIFLPEQGIFAKEQGIQGNDVTTGSGIW
jgi:hypothetical protein